MIQQRFRPGDFVIYRKTKHGNRPGPRAENIKPALHGDNYSYTVDKYWVVEEVCDDGTVVALTRRGKRNFLKTDDPLLQRASWWQRMLYRSRFPEAEDSEAAGIPA